MKKVMIILLMGCMAGALHAQDSKDSSNSINKVKKNEIVVNFKVNNSFPMSPSGIMYRRNFKSTSLRIGLNGSHGNRYQPKLDRREDHYSISPYIGIQKNVRLVDQFYFYWGADLVYNYREAHRSDSLFQRSVHSNSFGVSPFVGLRYSYKKLVLGVETAGSLFYRIQDQQEASSDPGFVPDSFHRTSLDFRPFNGTKFFIGITF